MRRASISAVMVASLALAAAPAMAQPGGGAAGQSGTSGAGSGQSSPTGGQAGTSGAGDTTSVAGGGQSAGSDMTGAQTERRDDRQEFIEKAAIANMAEIQLGQLAQQNAQDPQVKQFAKTMVDEHTKALEQLRAAAGSISLPSALDKKHQKKHDKLSKLQGAEFDRAYMDAMVDAHEDTEKLLKKRVGKDADRASRDDSTLQGQTAMSGTAGHDGMSGSASGSAAAGTSGSDDASGAPGSTSGQADASAATSGSSTSGAVGTSGTSASTASSAAPASVDEWAAMTLPKVRSHLEQARSLEDQVKQARKANDNPQGAGSQGDTSSQGTTSGAGSSSGSQGSSSGSSTPPQR